LTPRARAKRGVPVGEDGGERREEVTYVDVTIWGRQAEVAQQYVTKGKPVCIEGRLQLDTWQDKDGQKRSKLKVVCEHLQLLGSANGNKASSTAPAAKAGKPRVQAPAPRDPDLDAEPDDIPF
jgi:single-strand DNA-binding protein